MGAIGTDSVCVKYKKNDCYVDLQTEMHDWFMAGTHRAVVTTRADFIELIKIKVARVSLEIKIVKQQKNVLLYIQ